jgi:hypothetical protein
MPPRRIKRAAAAVAESKIKQVLEESINEDRKKGAKQKSSSFTVFEFDGVAPRPHKRRATRKKGPKSSSPRKDAFDERKQVPRSMQSSAYEDLGDLFYSSDGSTSFASMLEFSTVEKAHMEHNRRRSMRSINSTGPMHLSYRTSYRMSISEPMSQASPACSPILSTKLRFTPVAHLPTTPIPHGSNGSRRIALDLRSHFGFRG